MAENAFDILTSAAIQARRHACNKTKSCEFASLCVIVVFVRTIVSIWTFLSQVVNIAQLELLYTVDLYFVIVFATRIDALSSPIACNDLVAVSWLIVWYSRYGWRWCSRLRCPAGHRWRSHGGNEPVRSDG